MGIDDAERLERWRMILGQQAECEQGLSGGLSSGMAKMDAALEALYDAGRTGGLGKSCPNVNRWLGDIRQYFPSSTVQVMQRDAIERLGLQQMLLEPELLQQVEADVHLVGTLLALKSVIPNETKETARLVVQKVVEELQRKLQHPMTQAVRGSLNRAVRNYRPRANEIDWDRTIRKNLQHYIPERNTIIAEQLVGFGHKRASLRDIVLCVDQSGSMASSVVYSSIFGAVLASLRAVTTHMIVFDTEVADLTEDLQDPVDLLFGCQLGGGTDINHALAYCQQLITRPSETILVLITDLYEGGNQKEMVKRASALVRSGVNAICLLALSDEGTPSYNRSLAAQLTTLGMPSFACSPDQFPDLMAAAINRHDLDVWAAKHDIAMVRGMEPESDA